MSLYDVVIVGAGIQGAGVAQICAAQGWRTKLIERNAQAGRETSANSSKLIHGGLRYLETFQFQLVRECLKEQHYLLRNAPHLVQLKPFYIPVYKKASRSALTLKLGLFLYRLLGAKKFPEDVEPVSSLIENWGIKTEGLGDVLVYADAQTDDSALTEAVVESARQFGAEIQYSTEVSAVEKKRHFHIHCSKGEILETRVLINACGPWANSLAERIPGAPKLALDWVQGSHIVVDVDSFPGGFYFESPIDARAVFVLPWKGKTLVGTTETVLNEPQAKVRPEEVEYLLDCFNYYFPQQSLSSNDILETFSGIRVLPKAEGKKPNKRSRDTLFCAEETADSYYLAIYGGKLTAYRATAEKVLNKISHKMPTPIVRSTINISLPILK